MEKISEAAAGAGSNDRNSKISEEMEKSLQDWKLPPFPASNVYKGCGFFNIFSGCKVRTVEEEISFSEKFATFNLFSKYLKISHPEDFKYFDIGMVQVALKPSKLGSNLSATVCLRNKACSSFNESVWDMVESSLCNGPISFTYFPTPHQRYYSSSCYSASDFSTGVCIDVNLDGSSSSMRGGDESMILMYRFHYKAMNKIYRPSIISLSQPKETTLFLTHIAQCNRVVSKIISWDQVVVPVRWLVGYTYCSDNTSVMWEETAETLVLQLQVKNAIELKKEEVRVEVEDGSILQIIVMHNTFCRRFRLPENARLDKLTAAMENNGVTVTVPKEKDEKKGRVKAIDISS